MQKQGTCKSNQQRNNTYSPDELRCCQADLWARTKAAEAPSSGVCALPASRCWRKALKTHRCSNATMFSLSLFWCGTDSSPGEKSAVVKQNSRVIPLCLAPSPLTTTLFTVTPHLPFSFKQSLTKVCFLLPIVLQLVSLLFYQHIKRMTLNVLNFSACIILFKKHICICLTSLFIICMKTQHKHCCWSLLILKNFRHK